jgi:hypothetical protein
VAIGAKPWLAGFEPVAGTGGDRHEHFYVRAVSPNAAVRVTPRLCDSAPVIDYPEPNCLCPATAPIGARGVQAVPDQPADPSAAAFAGPRARLEAG